ncbi:hypothetical protein SAMN00777080_0293 [Aquiflexum balticum DSM 16537]|uniref:Uncharacterized protein n=1 Tax=Aquiflexum balticum DSM 16537 TaxID=758820 RepID=A0A1W2GZC9_9BACT|nr:hypothetical protein SAMN00777080_0293 [Aquiflexum balticum DSM 16537]
MVFVLFKFSLFPVLLTFSEDIGEVFNLQIDFLRLRTVTGSNPSLPKLILSNPF